MAAQPPPGYRVETLSFAEFLSLESAWNDLLLASARPSPFLTHQWIRTWWQHFSGDCEFRAVVVWADKPGSPRPARQFCRQLDLGPGDPTPLLVAATPIAFRPLSWVGRRLHVAEIVGTGAVPTRGMGLADRVEPLVRCSDEGGGSDAAETLTRVAARAVVAECSDAAVLHLACMPCESPIAAEIVALSDRTTSLRLLRSTSPFLRLRPTWDEQLDALAGGMRKRLRRERSALEREGAVRFRRAAISEDESSWWPALLDTERASWKAAHGTDLFRHPAVRNFFAELLPVMRAGGWLDLHLLELNGRPIAFELCFRVGASAFCYSKAYRADAAAFSPGTQLTAEVISAACNAGLREYDLLRGQDEYKTRWADAVRAEEDWILPTDRLRARAYAHAVLALKSRLRQRPWLRGLDDRLSGMRNRWRYPARASADQEPGSDLRPST